MSQENVNYAAVLADLEARRAVLDAAIAGVRAVLGQAPNENGSTIPEQNRSANQTVTTATEVKAGTFHGLSVSEAARRFLEMTKTKQRTKDIVDAIQRGGIESTAGSFYSNVYTTLMRRKDFKRLGKYWVLVEWNPTVFSAEKPTKPKRRGKGKPRAKAPGQTVAPTSEPPDPKG